MYYVEICAGVKMDRENRSKIYVIIIIVVLLIILGVVGYFLFGMLNSDNSAKLSGTEQTASSSVSSDSKTASKDKKPKNPIDFKAVNKQNNEIVAWIKVPDTKVDYPILQSQTADDFYLHRDVNRNSSYAGSIYMEYCNSSEFSDRVTVLYGHNMINGSMFAQLHKFEDKSFFDSKKHRYFYVYQPNRKLTYEVVSAFVYDDRHIMNSFNFAEDEIFEKYLDMIQDPRSYTKNVRKLNRRLTTDDKILTLSTCLNSGDGRYLLQGVLVKDELTR